MSEQQYRLEENNQTNELILWEDAKILNVFKSSYDNRKHLNIIVDRLNEQQSTIEQKDKEIAELDQQCADFLGDKIRALEEFEECTDKLKQKIFDYKFEIKKLKMENDALRYALKYVKHIEVDIDVDGVIEDE